MSRQRRRDTAAEMSLRRELHRQGFRYRVNLPVPGLPRRRADLTFARQKLAVFVDGCFWHGCPEHATLPKRNSTWWKMKLQRNCERDRETDRHLITLGWRVLRVWEHEPPEVAAERVRNALIEGELDP
ncbi:MAG: very short patch repair endonuclease [Nocardioides sp.]